MRGIWVPISGQIAQQQKVETIANNIANANTIGFKKDDVTFKEYLTTLEKAPTDIDIPRKDFSPEDMYRQAGNQRSHVQVAGSYTNFSQGELIPNNNPMNCALSGDGFYEVLTPNGIRLTRNGNFSLNANGELVTTNDHKLLGKSNDPKKLPEERIIKIPSNTKVIAFSENGDIYADNVKVTALSVVDVKDKLELKKEGELLYYLNNSDALENSYAKSNAIVKSGFTESSNVNSLEEMSELIKAQRQFESIQRVIQAYDSINNKAVNELMKF
jgi:flagellar basal-body rod protein FlgG